MGPIALDCAPRAEVSLPSLVQTDNKLLNKVLLVCAYLCEEVTALSAHAREKLLPSLLLLAEPGGGGAPGGATPRLEAEAAAAMPLLLSLLQFVGRANSLTINVVHQLASLYASKQRLFASTFKKVHMRRVFEALGELLGLLVHLDDALLRCSRLPPALAAYRRVVGNMRTDPARYGSTDVALSALDARACEVEENLFRGLLFRRAITQVPAWPPRACVWPPRYSLRVTAA